MKFLKILSLILCSLVLIACFAGCSSISGKLNGTYASDDGKYVVTFKNDGTCIWEQDLDFYGITLAEDTFFEGTYEKSGDMYVLYIKSTIKYITNTTFTAKPVKEGLLISGGAVDNVIFRKQSGGAAEVKQNKENEKNNKQHDEASVTELTHAVELCLADETVYDEVLAASSKQRTIIGFTIDDNHVLSIASAKLQRGTSGGIESFIGSGPLDSLGSSTNTFVNLKKELAGMIRDFTITSNAYSAYTSYNVTVDFSRSAIKVTGEWGTTSTSNNETVVDVGGGSGNDEQKDVSVMAEVAHAVEISLADEDIYDEVAAWLGGTYERDIIIKGTKNGERKTYIDELPKLSAALKVQIGDTVQLQSDKYKTVDYLITISMVPGKAIKVAGAFDN